MRNKLNIRSIVESSRYLHLILTFSTIFFSMGYIAETIDYIILHKTLLMWINAASMLMLGVIYILYKTKVLKVISALLTHISVVTLNLYLGMLHEAAAGPAGSMLHVVECLCICIIPAMLTGMTRFRWLPVAITAGAIGCYSIAAVYMGNPEGMLARIPAFTIVIVGIAYAFSYLLIINRRVERENLRIEQEQENILQLFDFTPKQWELIRSGRMSRERLEKLVFKMDKSAQEKMMYQVKEMAYADEEIKHAVRSAHSGLTAGDLELCVLIVKGKSAGEIAALRGLHHNSITAQRSRLRRKLGLSPEQNLNDYLKSIVSKNA